MNKSTSNPVTTQDISQLNHDSKASASEHTTVVRSERKSNGNTVDTNASMESSWATTISGYLLQRRAQTQQAYQGQLRTSDSESNQDDAQKWLFSAVFAVLVQRLEEGHTVLVLDSEALANESAQTVEDDDSFAQYKALHPWQRQLIQPLVQPLLAHAQDSLGESFTVTQLLYEDTTLWQKLSLQSTLPIYEQQILQQRYDISVSLYDYLQQLAQQSELTRINSLSNFKNTIKEKSLFSKAKKENDSPIVYTLEESTENQSIEMTLWLHRTWQAEYNLAYHIMRLKAQHVTELPIILNPRLTDEQKDAIHMANRSAFSIITGGPGTGKTFTVAQLVMALAQTQTLDSSGNANLALAAPTGKAAQRMQESLQNAIEQAGIVMQLPDAKTIHRLLGIGRGGQPRYHADNPLSEDIIIVDEASMLGVELANYLLSAIKANARLILLGDANQLAAVDAGAVLADLCKIPVLNSVHKRLESSKRFDDQSGIGKLAKLINAQNDEIEYVWTLMKLEEKLNFYSLNSKVTAEPTDNASKLEITNSLSNYKFYLKLENNYGNFFKSSKSLLSEHIKAKYEPSIKASNDFDNLLKSLNEFRVLTASHNGRCGDNSINQYLSEQHKKYLKLPLSKSPWYHGRPIMILQNNYELGLFNGDVGICVQTSDRQDQLQVFFENKEQGIAIHRFSEEMVATAYAMTIHKSQGSEFNHVAISFDDSNRRLLSQELIYTAVTRAKNKVSIFSTQSAFMLALSTPTVRQTGLRLQFEAVKE